MLTATQRRHLRALAHALHPLVRVGKGGIDEGLVAAADRALSDHELVKVKIGNGANLDRVAAAAELARRTSSAVVQVLGNVVLLYRADPEPRIELPGLADSNSA
jgi:RNA-binding protein